MAKLTALIGLARSGKSTFAREWQSKEDPDGLNRVVVNGDNVRLALHDHRFIFKAEPIVHGIYQTMVRALLLNPQLHVLMDDTHTTVSSIRTVLTIDDNAEFIYVPCNTEVARQRAIETNQTDLIPVIDRMHGNLTHLSNYCYKGCMGTYEPVKENIFKSIEVIRDEVRKIKEYSDRSV